MEITYGVLLKYRTGRQLTKTTKVCGLTPFFRYKTSCRINIEDWVSGLLNLNKYQQPERLVGEQSLMMCIYGSIIVVVLNRYKVFK